MGGYICAVGLLGGVVGASMQDTLEINNKEARLTQILLILLMGAFGNYVMQLNVPDDRQKLFCKAYHKKIRPGNFFAQPE